MEVTKEQLQTALEKSWARETSSTPEEWSEVNSSRGQCVPTALVAQDYLGGELQKLTTTFNGQEESHYRNILPDGSIFDASRSQYPESQTLQVTTVALSGFSTVRDKRLSEEGTMQRYTLLKERVERLLVPA